MMLKNTRIVLSHTTHPGNIGATARAMKTMGLTQLYLVNPRYFPHPNALEMASGAGDILDSAVVCSSLDEAIADCQIVVGTSARVREMPARELNPRQLGELIQQSGGDQVALLFGTEHSGLTNEELLRCAYHVFIPANPDYSSLNLAQAVQVISYECRMASLMCEPADILPTREERELATANELLHCFDHLEKTLKLTGFIKSTIPQKAFPRLKRMLLRAELDKTEVALLRGILTSIEKLGDHGKQ